MAIGFDPLVDYAFKMLFGRNDHQMLTISSITATPDPIPQPTHSPTPQLMLRNVQPLPTGSLTETQRHGEVQEQRASKVQVASYNTHRRPKRQRKGMTRNLAPLHIPSRSRSVLHCLCLRASVRDNRGSGHPPGAEFSR